MPCKKLTNRKLNALIRDERAANKEYKKLGLSSIARDEARHMRMLQKKKK